MEDISRLTLLRSDPVCSAAVSEEHARLPVPADAAGDQFRGADCQQCQSQQRAGRVLPTADPHHGRLTVLPPRGQTVNHK